MRSHGYGVTEELLRRIVRDVLLNRAPTHLPMVESLPLPRSMSDTTESIREILSDELVEAGLGPDDEPNEHGRIIEAAIDWLGKDMKGRNETDRA